MILKELKIQTWIGDPTNCYIIFDEDSKETMVIDPTGDVDKIVEMIHILKGDLTNIPEEIQEQYLPKLRCIPFSSLGKQNGMLLGIRAEKLEVSKDDEVKVTKNIIVGIYEKSLTKRGEYRALIGIEHV